MPCTKKSAPSSPAAGELDRLRTRLQTLVTVGDPQQVDKQLEQLLMALGLDPASPTAWRDGFCLLACLHYDIGKPPRTNTNAEKMYRDDDLLLIREMIQSRDRGLNQDQAIKVLVSNQSKEQLFKFKTLSSKTQRIETLRKRLKKIKRASRGDAVFRDIWGKLPESIVEEVLMNLMWPKFADNDEGPDSRLDQVADAPDQRKARQGT
jgi:DNA-binding transcriptional MerR regulator